jgi:hypothetical protein
MISYLFRGRKLKAMSHPHAKAPASRQPWGGPELEVLRGAAVAFASALVASSLVAQCSPPKLLRIVTQDVSPGVPAGSFATQPKTVYRLGKTYARVEEADDREHKIHGLIVVNSPDSWMVNLAEGTGRHAHDPDRDSKVRMPVLEPSMFSGSLPPEMLKLEIGCEVGFFNSWKSPVAVLKTPGGNKIKQAFGIGDFMLILMRDSSSGPPEMLVLFRKDEIVLALKYLSYEEVTQPDMKLFAKPDGVKFEEAGPV